MADPGPLALVGSGEFLPAMAGVDRELLSGRSRRVGVLSTAAAPEGPASLERWHAMARSHYAGLDAEAVIVDVRDRDDAGSAALAALLDDVGMVYLSGGNPGYLADTLRGSAVGAAIETAWRRGAAVAGCSAGAMALGAKTLGIRGGAREGLGLARAITVIPHFDAFGFASRAAGMIATLGPVAEGVTVVGVDEDTAAVWLPERSWVCRGAAKVWILSGLHKTGFGADEEIPLPLPR